jgi:hypothetical protein
VSFVGLIWFYEYFSFCQVDLDVYCLLCNLLLMFFFFLYGALIWFVVIFRLSCVMCLTLCSYPSYGYNFGHVLLFTFFCIVKFGFLLFNFYQVHWVWNSLWSLVMYVFLFVFCSYIFSCSKGCEFGGWNLGNLWSFGPIIFLLFLAPLLFEGCEYGGWKLKLGICKRRV